MRIADLSGYARIWSKKVEVDEIGPLWEMGHHEHSKLLSSVYVPCRFSHLRLFCTPVDYRPPGSSVHGILQAILEWVAMPSSRGSSPPRDQTYVSCPGRWIFYHWNHPVMRTQSFLEVYCMERGFRGYAGNGRDKPRR